MFDSGLLNVMAKVVDGISLAHVFTVSESKCVGRESSQRESFQLDLFWGYPQTFKGASKRLLPTNHNT